jgi:hypothetical protein
VDTVVTRYRGREIDKKVSRQRYTTPETHGSATATQNGQSSLSLFFIGAACAGTSLFFCFFFTNSNLGLKRRGPIWRWRPDGLRGRPSGAGRALAHPQTISAPTRPGDRGAAPGGRQPPPLGERGGALFCFFLI